MELQDLVRQSMCQALYQNAFEKNRLLIPGITVSCAIVLSRIRPNAAFPSVQDLQSWHQMAGTSLHVRPDTLLRHPVWSPRNSPMEVKLGGNLEILVRQLPRTTSSTLLMVATPGIRNRPFGQQQESCRREPSTPRQRPSPSSRPRTPSPIRRRESLSKQS
jgi:hypothetical protein